MSSNSLPRYIAMWNGGNGYADPSFDDAECFPSLEAARQAMRNRRYRGNDDVRPLVGDDYFVSFPVVDESSSMWLYATSADDTIESLRESVELGYRYAYVIEWGPRGGLRMA